MTRIILLMLTAVLALVVAADSQVRINGGSDITPTTVTTQTVNTGQGANELYDMDQNVLTTSTPTFAGEALTTNPSTATLDAIGGTATTGYTFRNTTAAAAGAQQRSPRVCWDGNGWKTDATAASQSVSICIDNLPVQGAAAPTGAFNLTASINGGAYSAILTGNTAGSWTFPNTVSALHLVGSGLLVLSAGSTITVDGATTFAITASYHVLACTGAETINTITGAINGTLLYLENSDTDCTIADDDAATASNAVDLTGTAANDVGAVAKVLTLLYTGTHWKQLGESDN